MSTLTSLAKALAKARALKYEPQLDKVILAQQERPLYLYHTTNADAPVISEVKQRLIPMSLSAKAGRPDYFYGQNAFRLQLPAGARTGRIESIFDLLPDEADDTPLSLGALLRKYAEMQRLDALRIGNVGGVGREHAIINPEYLKSAQRITR